MEAMKVQAAMAQRYVPGEALLLRGKRPHSIQFFFQRVAEGAQKNISRVEGVARHHM